MSNIKKITNKEFMKGFFEALEIFKLENDKMRESWGY